MDKTYALGLVLFLAGCGGGGANDNPSTSPSPPSQLEPVAVTITESSNGCLVSHNADAVVAPSNYGVSPGPQILLWNCANIGANTRVGVEAFFINVGPACYVERAIIQKIGNCKVRATAPTPQVVTGKVEIVGTPYLYPIGGGAYAAGVDVRITNTGNVTLFGVSLDVASDPLSFYQLFVGGPGPWPISDLYLLPGESLIVNGMPMTSANVYSGEKFTFTAWLDFMITDHTVLPFWSATAGPIVAP